MQFLKTLFWMMVAVIVAISSYQNWRPVSVDLWGGLLVDVKLPVLVLGAFFLGLIPGLVLYRTTRWRLGRRLDSSERALAEYRPADPAVSADTAPLPSAPLPSAPLPSPAEASPLVP
jgi:uncharacterized integral membrane protein